MARIPKVQIVDNAESPAMSVQSVTLLTAGLFALNFCGAAEG